MMIIGGDGSVVTNGILQTNGKVYADLINQIDSKEYEVTAVMILDKNRQIIAQSTEPSILNSNQIDPLGVISVVYTAPIDRDVRCWVVGWQYTDEDGNTILAESPSLTYSWETKSNCHMPVADAGPDQNVSVGLLTTLDGGDSSDLDEDALSYSWSFVSLPDGSTATLSDPTAVNPTFIADLDGIYVLNLVVNDGNVNSKSDSVIIQTNPTTVATFELPDGENAIYLLTSNFGDAEEFVNIKITDTEYMSNPILGFQLTVNAASTGDVFEYGGKSIVFTTTEYMGFGGRIITFGPAGIYGGGFTFSGYTKVNGENKEIATVTDGPNSEFVRYRSMGNGIYRIEVDVHDVTGATDGIDTEKDFDDVIFWIGPRANIESVLGQRLEVGSFFCLCQAGSD